MRYKPDGSLDEVWRKPVPKTMEQICEELIEALLRVYPTMSREEAGDHADAYM
jgi:hypothetical protein